MKKLKYILSDCDLVVGGVAGVGDTHCSLLLDESVPTASHVANFDSEQHLVLWTLMKSLNHQCCLSQSLKHLEQELLD